MAKRIAPVQTPVELTLDGKTLVAEKGEPLAHALLVSGRGPVIRSSKLRRARGPWCLRGACDGCLARVDGVPNVMTCMRAVRGGERVESQNSGSLVDADVFGVADWLFPNGVDHHHLLTGVPGADRVLNSVAERMAGLGMLPSQVAESRKFDQSAPDVVVVGAGPAGLATASALCARGLSPVVIDDGPMVGGSLVSLGKPRCEAFLAAHPTQGARWLRATTAVGIYQGRVLAVDEQTTYWLSPRAIVLAVGAQDAGPMFGGNDVPGVMAARAVARLASCGISPADHLVLAGQGVFASAVVELLGNHATIEKVPLDEIQEVEGRSRIRSVLLKNGKSLETQLLAVEGLRAPSFELAVQAGAQVHLEMPRGYVPEADSTGKVADKTWCIGECAGDDYQLERFVEQAKRLAAHLAETLR